MAIKTGLAQVWRVRFKKHDGYMAFVEYGDSKGPMIAKLRVIKEAKAELQRNQDYAEIDEIYPADALICYQCEKPVPWLAPDSRCKTCTRLTPEEVHGGL